MSKDKCICLNCGEDKTPYWYNPISDEGFCKKCYEDQPKSKLLELATGI